ncbi:hypothetical protein [Vibrio agarivorans]|uniref:hypothetical protein n=1 Tax=Vibrio agarivorans TaxID=153622 RepID=UPI0025B4B1B8|nr:hypothetical protein [Vibrio agarivorans]MDN3661184.1 hypothetical protein [Vibrio agarivorans]
MPQATFSKKHIRGLLVSCLQRTQQTLITTISIGELASYFSTTNLLPELRLAIDTAVNSKNVERVHLLENQLQQGAGGLSAPLSLTFIVMGKPKLTHSTLPLATLSYNPTETHIVGNVLGLIAISRTLGHKALLFTSRLSAKEAKHRGQMNDHLFQEQVEIRVVFDAEQGLGTTEVVELFRQGNIDTTLNLPHIGTPSFSDKDFPLQPFITKLIKDTDIEACGGVNIEAKHVKVSDRHITTQYILFKYIVGAVAGAGKQESSKMSKDIKLSNGQTITAALSDQMMAKIVTFLNAWLVPLRHQFQHDRSGYHLSPQLWQALGLTLNQLINDGWSISEIKRAGKRLGEMDYSKNAVHWNGCSVMELDAKGLHYKNSAPSTRLFRVGLGEYFVQLLV